MSRGFEKLIVYQKAYSLAMDVFNLTMKFPIEEKYSLIDQIRRSSRSVCTNIGEGYNKRIYPKHFVSKLSDSASECAETIIWLNFAKDCKYLAQEKSFELINKYSEVSVMLNFMINNPEKFIITKSQNENL